MKRQGYAAREFAKQGVKPGELAIISREVVSFLMNNRFVVLGSFVLLLFDFIIFGNSVLNRCLHMSVLHLAKHISTSRVKIRVFFIFVDRSIRFLVESLLGS